MNYTEVQNLDLFEMEQKLDEVRRILDYLNDNFKLDSHCDSRPFHRCSFPLQQAASFVDNLIHSEKR